MAASKSNNRGARGYTQYVHNGTLFLSWNSIRDQRNLYTFAKKNGTIIQNERNVQPGDIIIFNLAHIHRVHTVKDVDQRGIYTDAEGVSSPSDSSFTASNPFNPGDGEPAASRTIPAASVNNNGWPGGKRKRRTHKRRTHKRRTNKRRTRK